MDVSTALRQAAGLKTRIDDILRISAYDENADYKDSGPSCGNWLVQAAALGIFSVRFRKPVPCAGMEAGIKDGERILYCSGSLVEVLLQGGSNEVFSRVQTKSGEGRFNF